MNEPHGMCSRGAVVVVVRPVFASALAQARALVETRVTIEYVNDGNVRRHGPVPAVSEPHGRCIVMMAARMSTRSCCDRANAESVKNSRARAGTISVKLRGHARGNRASPIVAGIATLGE